ncbi:disease resistance protein (TIR-NBS-LRR class) family [Artemisia annua]|uniref:Disease resistance protein (TIR-NBS-LRR class) family n=1 Tax=Artemisia annua TaxID=35608 RepID=A0A2U1P7P1_ARTAN|nr:disease resistance protein (TIR-NBS-LRR class) family [Artemisia annua]
MASSSLPTRGWTYEVFLSFRGEDTRDNFVDHLHAALVQKGLYVFKDDVMLRRGKEISFELLKAIQESKFAVVVFSKNYANSSWCLDELAKIMECQCRMGQKMLPVFYHVDPSDVRKQIGDFTFKKHMDKFKDEVNKWREALAGAANLSGWHIPEKDNGGENAFINNIVQEILDNIHPRGNENNLIGIEFHMNALNSLLKIEETKGVQIIGIYGMGGLGKTTIAQALFRRIAYKFEGSSFVKDVLLVLDDVDDVKQLEYLAATHQWFGLGSRIIITTRDEHLLSDANAKYKPALLNMDQATELFSRHAFRKNSPPDGYRELSKRAIRSAGYLPLALIVLGSFFRGRDAGVWGSALDRLAKTPDIQIFETLKLSFDSLNFFVQKIFLDIACFFKGREVNDVTRVLDSFGFYPEIGISSLIEKSLIIVSSQRLDMHDLIQEMGWQIVHKSFPDSRLWHLEQIHNAMKKKRELEFVEAIVMPNKQYNVDFDMGFSGDVFESMKNLRLLNVYQTFTSAVPTIFPDELRWLCWDYYPFSSLPVAHMDKVVGIKIFKGRIQYLWEEQTIMWNLKFIDLRQLVCLARFPNVSMAPNIERLILSNCEYLLEVDESLGSLKRLVYLDLSHCGRLKCLPLRIEMESLETLILSFCTSLERFPEFSQCMIHHLDLQIGNHIPVHLSTLLLRIDVCGSGEVAGGIRSIQFYGRGVLDESSNLKSLFLGDFPKLQKLPNEFGRLQKLEELEMAFRDDCMMYVGVPKSINMHSFTTLSSLKRLDLSLRQIGDEDFPKNLHGLSLVERLNLSGNHKLTKLPIGVSHLSNLKHLDLKECSLLENLHGIPSGIEKIWLHDCHKLLRDEESKRYLEKTLKQSFLKKRAAEEYFLSVTFPGCTIPSWFKEQQCGNQIAFKFEYDGICISYNSEVDCINALTKADDVNMWLGYIPFSLFQKRHHGDDFQHENWFRVTEEDKESKRYLGKMLKPSLLKKWVAVEGSLSVTFPGSNVPRLVQRTTTWAPNSTKVTSHMANPNHGSQKRKKETRRNRCLKRREEDEAVSREGDEAVTEKEKERDIADLREDMTTSKEPTSKRTV